MKRPLLSLLTVLVLIECGVAESVSVTDQPSTWCPMVIDVSGPTADESDSDLNPFLDYRLRVTLTGPADQKYIVPGFFAGNGDGGPSGSTWRIRFSPDQAGEWKYAISFQKGEKIAIRLDAGGEPLSPDGTSGTFTVVEPQSEPPGFYDRGRLEYTGKHYLSFRDGGYWIKGGVDSPENFLAYKGFDGSIESTASFDRQKRKFPLHDYHAHKKHWEPGDPDWGNGDGKGIIGALNYLSSKHVNSIYFLTMNIGGDGKDVFPWIGSPDPSGSPDNDNLHYDVSKLRQWNTVFGHAQRKGIFLHFVLNEAEEANKRELDDGELGTERKLYYRELVARFGHHLALQWNLCEEYNIKYDLGPERVTAFARYLRRLDPYNHPITVHSAGDPRKELAFTYGTKPFENTSVQLNQRRIGQITEDIRRGTAEAGRPLPASMDEFTVDTGQDRSWIPVDNADLHRKRKIWPTYLSGGQIEFILEGLLNVNRFNTEQREQLWEELWHARKFLLRHLPFHRMRPKDDLLTYNSPEHTAGQVFSRGGEVYAVYLPDASRKAVLDLSEVGASTRLTGRWYNPRTGSFQGSTSSIRGGKQIQIGPPPVNSSKDWVLLYRTPKDKK